MSKFRPFKKYKLSLTKSSDGHHNLRAESNEGSHNFEVSLSPDEAYRLLSKGRVEADGRVNGTVTEE
jgi:hypothetical protein